MPLAGSLAPLIFLPPPLLRAARNPLSLFPTLFLRWPSSTSTNSSSSSTTTCVSSFPLTFLLRSAASGALAEVFVNATLYPLDTLKVRTQNATPFTSRAFAGMRAGVLASALDAFVFTFVYEALRHHLSHNKKGQTQWWHDVVAGGMASVASAGVDAPFALARDRMRLGMDACMQGAWKSAGSLKGVYAAAVPALLRDVPGEAIEFAAYDALKRASSATTPPRNTQDSEKSPVRAGAGKRLVMGAVAGALMGVVCTPLDLAVTRIVAGHGHGGGGGVLKVLAKVAREEGAKATFASVPHRAAREALSSALFFAIYDGLKGDAERH